MIAVTGATGLIGKELVKRLSKKYKVRALVRKTSNTKELERLGIQIFVCDLSSKNSLSNALKNIELVVHLAAVRTPSRKASYEINIIGTKNLVQACIKNNVKRLIFMSTANVLLKRKDRYVKSKLEAEKIVAQSGVDYLIIRSTLVYDDFGNNDLIRVIKFVKKLPVIPVAGKGEYGFQPVYVKDLVRILDICCSKRFNKLKNKIITIGGPARISFNDLLQFFIKNLRLKRVKIHVPLRLLILARSISFGRLKQLFDEYLNIAQDRIVDQESIKKKFGFTPKTVEEGLKIILKNVK